MANYELPLPDADLEALSASTDDNTGHPFFEKGKDPHYNEYYRQWWHHDTILKKTGNALRVYKSNEGDLKYGVRAGSFWHGPAKVDYAGTNNEDLTNNATNYLYLTSAGVLTLSTSAFPAAAHVPLAIVLTGTASAAAVDGEYEHQDITDVRDRAIFRTVGQQELTAVRVPLTSCRNADGTALGASESGGSGNFYLNAGGWGDGALGVNGNTANSDTETDTLSFEWVIPGDYVASGDLVLRVRAAYYTAGGETLTTKTIDAEVYELDDDGAAGADLCGTAAIALTTSAADCDFTITDAGLAPGDRLMILVQTSLVETAAANTNALVDSIELQYDRAIGY